MAIAKKKILIVDDELHMRTLLLVALERLEEAGVEFLTASSGAEALKTIQEEHPDLVLLDVMMPKMSGYEVCEKIKSKFGDIYVIFLTARGQAVDYERELLARADECIVKPFDPDEMVSKVERILGIGS